MENEFIIVPGDDVLIQIDAEGHASINGTVRSMPCATGDAVVISNTYGVHYIQQYYVMSRKAKP